MTRRSTGSQLLAGRALLHFLATRNKRTEQRLEKPGSGEAVPQALSVAPMHSVEQAIEKAHETERVDVVGPPHPLHDCADVAADNVDHLTKRKREDVQTLT